jgi:tripartite ATP-independent transporter DctM subunit
MNAALLVCSALGLMLIGVPISFSLGAASLGYLLIQGIPPISFVQQLATGIDSFTLLALPFFILAGNLMNLGGITRKIFQFANAIVGHIRGGLGHANILASMIFACISGSAAASAGALGTIQLSAMEENHYPRPFSVGLISAAMTIGPVIPPSVIMVVYGIAAGVSIGELFIGGVIPGIIMGIGLMITVAWYARGQPGLPKYHDRFSMRDLKDCFLDAIIALIAPVIVIGGIIFGIFTATEAGAVAAAYAFFVGRFWYRELTFKGLWQAFVNTMSMSAAILLIMGMSTSFGWILAFEQAPAQAASWLLSFSDSPNVILLLLMGMYLILGCFLEAIAIVVMTIPVVMPIITNLGIDPVHFGVIIAVNMSIGTITPPLGLVTFVMTNIARISMQEFAKSILPFLIPLVGSLALFTLMPSLVTFLPQMMR